MSRKRFLGWCGIVAFTLVSLVVCFFSVEVGAIGLVIAALAAFGFGLSGIEYPSYREYVARRACSLGFTETEARVISHGPWRELWRIDDEHATLVQQRISDAKNRRADAELRQMLGGCR
jgi:hypothetical protein